MERLIVSGFKTGLETNVEPFLLDNDAFPVLNNAFQWRKRVRRKRGISFLGRLQIDLTSQALGNSTGAGTFSGNIFTILGIETFAPNASIVLGSITISLGIQTWTEPSPPDGTLDGDLGGIGTINYQTGALTLGGGAAASPVTIDFSYYPALPVLGFEDFDIGLANQEIPIAFDPSFSYGFNQGTNLFYNTTFYKSTGDDFQWQGEDYEQFYSTNYLGTNSVNSSGSNSGCLWVTNGNPGFHFSTISTVVIDIINDSGSIATVTTSAAHGLTDQDFVYINEVAGINPTPVGTGTPTRLAGTYGGINGVSGQVTVTGATTFTIAAPYCDALNGTGGIFQYMTQATDASGDGIRWYDGDPTSSSDFGWVNFAPPLSEYDSTNNPTPLYLTGAKIILPFKNRLLCFGVTMRTSASSPGNQLFANRLVYSQVGSPYYAQPLPFDLSSSNPEPQAWYQNIGGRGGFIVAPVDEQIITVDYNEDLTHRGNGEFSF